MMFVVVVVLIKQNGPHHGLMRQIQQPLGRIVGRRQGIVVQAQFASSIIHKALPELGEQMGFHFFPTFFFLIVAVGFVQVGRRHGHASKGGNEKGGQSLHQIQEFHVGFMLRRVRFFFFFFCFEWQRLLDGPHKLGVVVDVFFPHGCCCCSTIIVSIFIFILIGLQQRMMALDLVTQTGNQILFHVAHALFVPRVQIVGLGPTVQNF
mmetsp:Transcript_10712/g.25710  ORF Transcript_10712/g.25710 Transcript_10712/m.25710 type:complete len:207 (+) Transcript_10712:2679-3299(+)